MDDGGYDITTLLQQLDIADESPAVSEPPKQAKSPEVHNGHGPQAQSNSPGSTPQRGPPLTHQTLAAHQQVLSSTPQTQAQTQPQATWQSAGNIQVQSPASSPQHLGNHSSLPQSTQPSVAPSTVPEYQTVIYNNQVFQVPYGMALAQVSPNGQIEQLPQQVVQSAPQYAAHNQQGKPAAPIQQQFAQAPPYHFGSLSHPLQFQVGAQPQVVTVAPYQTQMSPQLTGASAVGQRFVPQMVQFGPNGPMAQMGAQMQQVMMPAEYQLALQQQQQQLQGFRGVQGGGAPVMQYQQLSAPQYQAVTQALQSGQQPVMISVPPGMTPEHLLSQLQSNGFKGQIMQYNAQGQIQPAAFSYQQPQQAPQPQPQQQHHQQQPQHQPQQQPQPQQQQQLQMQQSTPNRLQAQQQSHPQPSQHTIQQQQQRTTTQSAPTPAAAPARYATQPVQQQPAAPAARGEGAEDLTKLNPKATPFVPKVSATPASSPQPLPPPTQPAAQPPVTRSKDSTITCMHCNETGFLTEYVLRSHIKAKHSAESQVAPPGTDHANKAVVNLNTIIRQYLTNECSQGSVAFDHLNRYLEATHAVALGEAMQVAKSFAEILAQGNFRRFAYTTDELQRAEIRVEIARAGEPRVALPNVDYISSDTNRSKAFALSS